MPKIIETEKKLFKNAVIKEEDIPSIAMRIRGHGKIEGKDLYGFFVTKKEFTDKLASIYCSDGWYDIPILKYDAGEPIVLAIGYSRTKKTSGSGQSGTPSLEFLKKVREGAFIKQSEVNIRKTLKKLNIPIRQIRFWHKLGWAFAK